MCDMKITFSRGKDLECTDVEKVTYTVLSGEDITIEGADLLLHHFPIDSMSHEMKICTKNKFVVVSTKEIRTITIEPTDEL